jgi:4-hydroxy-tetrahydrodipicolinate reductase
MKRKDAWENELSRDEEKLSIISKREPNVPGTHEISYTGLNDELSIKHQANNRDGFALGSILAAKWLVDQESGVYSMRDFLKIK